MIQYKSIEKVYINSSTMPVEFEFSLELPFMEKLFTIQSPSGRETDMTDFLSDELSKRLIPFTVDAMGNILATKGVLEDGEFYPCLVAHQDTVFADVSNIELDYETDKGQTKIFTITKENGKYYYTGCGFDDKNGIWIALKMLDYFPKLKLYFSVQEETGGGGSKKVDMSFFKDVAYCIQCDRRGNNEVITNIGYRNICSDEFKEAIMDSMTIYGYTTGSGMFTDVDVLRDRNVDVACINIGCGYYSPHNDSEYTIIEDLFRCASLVKSIITDCSTKRFEYKEEKPSFTGSWYDDHDYAWDRASTSYSSPSSWKPSKNHYSEIEMNTCSCQLDVELIDVNCPVHNEEIAKYSGLMCECGEELEERAYSYYCNFCSKTFVLAY